MRGPPEKCGNYLLTSTGLYRKCAALAHVSGPFDLILFEAVNIEFLVEKVWFGQVSFGLVWTNLALLWLSSVCLIEFGLLW